jgi:putative transposon-encoded protein
MPRRQVHEKKELKVEGFSGFFEKRVTRFGNGAKIDCPKIYLGRSVYVVVRLESETRAAVDSAGPEPAPGDPVS